MTKRKKEDFYSEDGKIEYCFDKYGNRHEVGPSFKDVPMGIKVAFCPICYACKNKEFLKEKKRSHCKIYGELPRKYIFEHKVICDSFNGDETSYDYDIVMKQIREYNDKEQEE